MAAVGRVLRLRAPLLQHASILPQLRSKQPYQCNALHTSRAALGILKGIDPMLTADLLWVLRSAGHGDDIAVVDANFPGFEVSTKTTSGYFIQLTSELPETLDSICSVYPLDFFVDSPASHMAPTEGPLPPLGQEVIDKSALVIQKHCPGVKVGEIERFQFYEEARNCFAVIQCVHERRPYGNFILKKGVVGPDGNDLKP
eukprot:m.31473 g.31473  ORF g.31473 m.31473 type:complete len:200 (-) comp8321_c0_seq1:83-682(-)